MIEFNFDYDMYKISSSYYTLDGVDLSKMVLEYSSWT